MGISGLVVEYIVAIDVTRVRCPADALFVHLPVPHLAAVAFSIQSKMDTLGIEPRVSRMLSGCDTTTPRALCKGAMAF